VSQSLELSQISVTVPRLPPRKDSAVAECTSGTSVGPGELCTSGVSVGPGELCTSGTFATNTWETRSGDGTPASSGCLHFHIYLFLNKRTLKSLKYPY